MLLIEPSPPGPVAVLTSPDVLTITDNVLIPWIPGRGQVAKGANLTVKGPPTGADIVVDILLITRATGATVSTLQTLTIPAGQRVSSVPLVGFVVKVLESQALAAAITQVGSTYAGDNLTVEVYGPPSGGATGPAAPASAIIETGGPTVLAVGAVADGKFLKRVGATIVGADAGGGALELVATQTVVGADVQDILFAGVDGEGDDTYVIEYEIEVGAGGASILTLRPNNLQTNQETTRMGFSGVGAGYASSADLFLAAIGDQGGYGQAKFSAHTGKRRRMFSESMNDDSGGIQGQAARGVWNDLVTVLTDIVLHSSVAGGIAAGSRFTLYRMVNG